MRFSKLLRFWGLIAFALTGYFVAGCGKPSSSDESPEMNHIRKVVQYGRDFYATHKLRAPKDIAELRDWAIKEKGATEDDFKSTRDGQEYLIGAGMMGGVIVAEQTGKGGIRYGTGPTGAVQRVTDEQANIWLKGEFVSKRATGGRAGAADTGQKKNK